MPHFGCLLTTDNFKEIAAKLKAANITFLIEPTLRYPGKVGEQWTMFVLDYSNNPIEFKSFSNSEEVFAV